MNGEVFNPKENEMAKEHFEGHGREKRSDAVTPKGIQLFYLLLPLIIKHSRATQKVAPNIGGCSRRSR
ncbi:hypothetical protein SDJN03_11274, partial [Cucurbita argyrosperma subsp. sororia]